MALEGNLTKTNDGFEGYIASVHFDLEIALRPNTQSTGENAPDMLVFAKSPRGREIQIGGMWERISRAEKPYMAMTVRIEDRQISANIFSTETDGEYNIRQWAS